MRFCKDSVEQWLHHGCLIQNVVYLFSVCNVHSLKPILREISTGIQNESTTKLIVTTLKAIRTLSMKRTQKHINAHSLLTLVMMNLIRGFACYVCDMYKSSNILSNIHFCSHHNSITYILYNLISHLLSNLMSKYFYFTIVHWTIL